MVVSNETSKVFKFRLFTPRMSGLIRNAPDAFLPHHALQPAPRDQDLSRCHGNALSWASSRIATISNTQSAPNALASKIWYSSMMKSFLSTGKNKPAWLAADKHRYLEKNLHPLRTERQVAPAAHTEQQSMKDQSLLVSHLWMVKLF